jgi:hypothetical protein
MLELYRQEGTKAFVTSFMKDNPGELCMVAVRRDIAPFAEDMATRGLIDEEQAQWLIGEWKDGSPWIMQLIYPYGVPTLRNRKDVIAHLSELLRIQHGK